MTSNYKNTYLLSYFIFLSFFSINSFVLNPVYIVSFFTLIYFAIVSSIKFSMKRNILFLYLFVILFLISQFCGLSNTNIENKNYLSILLFCYSMILGIFTISIFYNKISLINRLRTYTLIYKIFCIFILNFIFFYLYIYKRNIYKLSRIYFFILWLLLFCTFSRAAFISGIISYFVLYNTKNLKFKIISFLIIFLMCIFILFKIYMNDFDLIQVDGSFNSKFFIIKIVIENYLNFFSTINKIFGIGLGNFEGIFGIFAHNMYVTFIVEFGILGSILLIIPAIYFIRQTNYMCFFIFLPNFIAGFSLFSAYSPFIFLLTSLIFIEEKEKRRI